MGAKIPKCKFCGAKDPQLLEVNFEHKNKNDVCQEVNRKCSDDHETEISVKAKQEIRPSAFAVRIL